MVKYGFVIVLCSNWLWSQVAADQRYREDQLFISVTYPFFTEAPSEITQNQFSHTLQLGFVRDMPINPRRNLSLGVGLGLSYNVLYNNLRYLPNSAVFEQVESPETNRWKWTEINLPFELRWRTSSPELYKFWRIYGGITASHALHTRQIYQDGGVGRDVSELLVQKWRWAFHISVGNNTWNLYGQYPLTPFLEDTQEADNDALDNLGCAKIGLIFYLF